MTDCIFCKIVEGKLPCFKIWENEEFLAFLDIAPNTKGQTLLIPKKHYDSDLFVLDTEIYEPLLSATKEVVELLKKGLAVPRVAMVLEGLEVPHLHVKLYPLYADRTEVGFSTASGPQADMEELGALQVQINNAAALN
ncbi:MAG: HIT domain-containing protein [Candidatus Absconditabacteria bacterium]|nr:HIT domain-containing protein [Candidatus Absconditabacteria bacterium]MDD3868026.1 HIT domain-containing protein [Candidatus Absconditabacteria bacterium]MDD4714273.1 HIT domain-containing protein [Candidatus Absconditabacteria bacterium]